MRNKLPSPTLYKELYTWVLRKRLRGYPRRAASFLRPAMMMLVIVLFFQAGCKKSVSEKRLAYVLEVQADQNRQELEKVLRYYQEEKPDKEKLMAARFLIANMVGHTSSFLTGKQVSVNLDSIIRKADAELYSHVLSIVAIEKEYTELSKRKVDIKLRQQREDGDKYLLNSSAKSEIQRFEDCKYIKAAFLINHIEHIFSLRNSRLSHLSFENFCEYLLPYKPDPYYPMTDPVQTYYALMNKYFKDIPVDSAYLARGRYKNVAGNFRNILGKYPYADTKIGYEELFFSTQKHHDCTPISFYAVSILRACGYPSAIEFNVAYKQFHNKHSHCVMLDKDEKWHSFSPELGIITSDFNDLDPNDEYMNIYRFMHSIQDENPCLLRKKDEYVPPELASPFIKDVSKERKLTVSLTLPIDITGNNNVVYLATFSSQRNEGIVPVTWGRTNGLKSSARFENVVVGETGRLYFPIYYSNDGQIHPCGDPFFLDKDSKRTYYPEPDSPVAKVTANVTRKFPRKRSLIKRADALTGTLILGSKDPSHLHPDTLATIGSRLEDYLQDVVLDISKGPYMYYEIKAPEGVPGSWIQEAYFLGNQKEGTAKAVAAPALPVFSFGDSTNRNNDFIKIESELHHDGQKYDKNKLYLQKPRYVHSVRLRPSSADNGIKAGNQYVLMEWRDKRWNPVETRTANCNSLRFELQQNRLYWLRCLTEGKEEGPFLIDESGNQRFIYHND